MSGALTYRRRTALPVAEPHSEPRPARIAYLALIYYRETSQVPSFTLQLELHTQKQPWLLLQKRYPVQSSA